MVSERANDLERGYADLQVLDLRISGWALARYDGFGWVRGDLHDC